MRLGSAIKFPEARAVTTTCAGAGGGGARTEQQRRLAEEVIVGIILIPQLHQQLLQPRPVSVLSNGTFISLRHLICCLRNKFNSCFEHGVQVVLNDFCSPKLLEVSSALSRGANPAHHHRIRVAL